MEKKITAYIITDNAVTVCYNGETHIVKRTDALADKLIKALKEGREEEIPDLVSAAKRIETFSEGNFTVKDGKVFVKGVEAPQVLSDKIVRFSNDGLPFKPLLRFAENLQANPSFRAVNELFGFLEKNDHPITPNGCFIAYKRVRGDFKDIYTGTFDNSVGQTPEVPRNQVDEDCTKTCSDGLHVANWTYAHTQYGNTSPDTTDIMLEVEVNPADVVAVPIDYSNAKMRVCKYKVLAVVTTPFDPSESLRVSDSDKKEAAKTQEDVVLSACCEEELCGCPFNCGCECSDSYCDQCSENEYNYSVCEICGEENCSGECEEDDSSEIDLEEDNKTCCQSAPQHNCCNVTTDTYPFEDELSGLKDENLL